MAICVEGVGLGPFEGAVLRLDSRGRVVVTSGAPPQGQGYQTAFAQIAADAVGVRYEDVDVVTGDTGAIPYGVGSFASRVTANAGPAILQAGGALREKILAVGRAPAGGGAGRPRDRRRRGARARAARPRRCRSPQVARLGNAGVGFGMVMPGGLPVGLEASAYFTPSQAGYSASAHVCILDVDPETGEVTIVRYVVGHDCGNVINPLIVEGQILGGVAHGLSNALYEEAIYDEEGQSLASELPRLPAAVRARDAARGDVPPDHAEPDQPARRQGRGRGRHAAGHGRGGRRRRGRAPPLRRAGQPHAAEPRAHQRPRSHRA